MRAKKWLSNNKIFFEISTATALTAMSIIVSIVQCSISDKQREIAELELNLMLQSNSPYFTLSSKYKQRDSTYVEVLEVYNSGAPVSGFQISEFLFLEINLAGNTTNEIPIILIPLEGYYDSHSSTGAPEGLQITSECMMYSNVLQYHMLDMDILHYCIEHSLFISAQIQRYAYIEYQDLMDDFHRVYYHYSPLWGSYRLTNEQGQNLLEHYIMERSEMRYISLATDSLEQLVSLLRAECPSISFPTVQ